MENKEQVYSREGEYYYSYEDLMHELSEYHNIGESVEVWEADKKERKHFDFIDVHVIIENIQVDAMDRCGEIAEEYLNELNEMQKLDLHIYLADWFDKNVKMNFYGIKNPRKVVVIVE